ncbi:hypothetical protein Tco_1120083, partial [Tanacetum coccineum]
MITGRKDVLPEMRIL